MIIAIYLIENYEIFLKQGFHNTVEFSVCIRKFSLSLLFQAKWWSKTLSPVQLCRYKLFFSGPGSLSWLGGKE